MEWGDGDWDATGSDGPCGGSGVDPRVRHKLAERERRKSMRELFLSLHGLLPHAHSVRKEQSAILDEIIKYIPLAAARLKSLQTRRTLSRTTTSPAHVSDPSDWNIRVAPDSPSPVSIRVRGDRVNVSLTDIIGPSQAVLLSAVLDELQAHHLDLVNSTYCRDGSKLLHHSESKIIDGSDRSPTLLKERLQDLASKLHRLQKSSLKRTFDQIV